MPLKSKISDGSCPVTGSVPSTGPGKKWWMVVPNGVAIVCGMGCGCAGQPRRLSSSASAGFGNTESSARPAPAAPAEDQRKLRREILMGVLLSQRERLLAESVGTRDYASGRRAGNALASEAS